MSEIYEIGEGELAEGMPWTIEIDHLATTYSPKPPCPHAKPFQDSGVAALISAVDCGRRLWHVPRVIRAKIGPGGWNSTVLCLDCVLFFEQALREGTLVAKKTD